ncbi:EAL domain-containing protein [Rhodovastum atsumiense]|nr:EAL domain-containing protein [Rhodovastum atsumiense]
MHLPGTSSGIVPALAAVIRRLAVRWGRIGGWIGRNPARRRFAPLPAMPLRLRTRLTLGFLSVAAFVALCGMVSAVLVLRGQASIATLTETITPLRIEAMELQLTAQRLNVTLLATLADRGRDTPLVDQYGIDLPGLEQHGEEKLAALRRLAARAGITLQTEEPAATQQEVVRLMRQMLEANRAGRVAEQAARQRLQQFRDAGHALEQSLVQIATSAEIAIMEAEAQARRGVRSGTATVDGLGTLMSVTLAGTFPVERAADRLLRELAGLSGRAERFLGFRFPDGLDAVEAEIRRALWTMDVLVQHLAAQLRPEDDPARVAAITTQMATLRGALLDGDGVLARWRETLALRLARLQAQPPLSAATTRYGAALARISTAAEALEAEARARTDRDARHALIGLAVTVLGGSLLAVMLGMDFARRMLQPLSRLDEAVRGLAAGRLQPGVGTEGRGLDELDSMAAAVLERVAHLATHDSLTGLPNRALFREHLEQALARVRRGGEAVAVHCLDIDHFKEVNDTLGHAAGDALLVQVAARLAGCIRETDRLARLGGDEFAIVQCDSRQPAHGEILARRILAAMAEPFDLGGQAVVAGASLGISVRSGQDAPADAAVLLQEADVALYQSKESGRGAFHFFEADMNRRLRQRKTLEADLRTALSEGQFHLAYQPQIDLCSGALVGAEALIRWQHPTRGEVRPDEFIPIAEQTGQICQIGEWVLRTACAQAVAWPGLARMSVNVSPTQFRQAGFLEVVEAILAETGLAPRRLELEVTESLLLVDTEVTFATLTRLRGRGVSIAMDDFGTGYSSLGYLRRFPFDRIKIDRSFVRGLGSDPEAAAIVNAVIGMSHSLRIGVNAEGVETAAQAKLLRAVGCEEVQGYLYGRPLAPEAFSKAYLADTDAAALPAA